jgi:mRNA interferase YafQ
MRTTRPTRRFERDVERLKAGILGDKGLAALAEARFILTRDWPLPASRRDHPLKGEWKGCRECHLLPDLLLIYRKVGDDILELIRLGSHSELF